MKRGLAGSKPSTDLPKWTKQPNIAQLERERPLACPKRIYLDSLGLNIKDGSPFRHAVFVMSAHFVILPH